MSVKIKFHGLWGKKESAFFPSQVDFSGTALKVNVSKQVHIEGSVPLHVNEITLLLLDTQNAGKFV